MRYNFKKERGSIDSEVVHPDMMRVAERMLKTSESYPDLSDRLVLEAGHAKALAYGTMILAEPFHGLRHRNLDDVERRASLHGELGELLPLAREIGNLPDQEREVAWNSDGGQGLLAAAVERIKDSLGAWELEPHRADLSDEVKAHYTRAVTTLWDAAMGK
jgi:hypothetical protein